MTDILNREGNSQHTDPVGPHSGPCHGDGNFCGQGALKLVQEVMTTRVHKVGMDDTLRSIQAVFAKANFHHILVMEQDRLMGIISDRDLLKHLSHRLGSGYETQADLSTLNKKAHQIMSRRPVTVLDDASVKEAACLMLQRNVSCLPVVDASDRVAGILSWKDLLRHTLVGCCPD